MIYDVTTKLEKLRLRKHHFLEVTRFFSEKFIEIGLANQWLWNGTHEIR